MRSVVKKTIVKTICWRTISILITAVLVFLTTGDLDLVYSIGVLDASIKTISMFFYDSAWQRHFAKEESDEKSV
jgi:uncharacterized membrane protein